MLTIDELRELARRDNCIAVTKHAKIRLQERGITIGDIQHAIQSGEIIKQYPDDKPFPSCLLLGKSEQNRFMHLVASIDGSDLHIITAYFPDENEWEPDFKTRKTAN